MSAEPWSNIGEEATLEDADSVMLLLDGESAPNANKRSRLDTLKSFILDTTEGAPIFCALDSNSVSPIGESFYPISGTSRFATVALNKLLVQQIPPIDGTYRNLTLGIFTNTTTLAGNKIDLLNDNTVIDTIDIPNGGGAATITSSLVNNIPKGSKLSYRLTLANGDAGKLTLIGISITTDVVLGTVNAGSAILSSPNTQTGIIEWGNISSVGTGISATADNAIYKLSGNIFQLNAFIEIDRSAGSEPTSLVHQWSRADNFAFTINAANIGSAVKPITVDSSIGSSSIPMNVAFVDARTQDIFVRLETSNIIGNAEVSGFSWAQIFSIGASSPKVDVETEFTWAVSDEESPLSEGILYLTEVASETRSIPEAILSLRNTPTNNAIEVNIIQESAADSNIFNVGDTIFDTNPQIDTSLFSSLNSGQPGTVKTNQTWDVGKRLQIILVTKDDNDAATGLKVTLL